MLQRMNRGSLPAPTQVLLDSLDDHQRYAITVEGKMDLEDVEIYEEVHFSTALLCMVIDSWENSDPSHNRLVRDEILGGLTGLRETPNWADCLLSYNHDVAAIYLILSP